MAIIAKVTYDVTSEATLRGLTESAPKYGYGVSGYHVELIGQHGNGAGNHQNGNGQSNRRGRQPSDGKPSIAQIILATFGDGETFTYKSASDKVQVEGYGELSVGSALTRMQQKNMVARLGGGLWKVTNRRAA